MATPRTFSARRSPTRVRAPKLTRAERSEVTRQALFDAAVSVVGEVGYANAMIAEITARAKVAHGTFYNYFESRQDLFDALLPELGGEMLKFIGEQTQDAVDEIDREERGFQGFFAYLKKRPEFYRILYEAEVFAPEAFQKHEDRVARGYVRTLQRAMDQGQLEPRPAQELEAIAFMLMGVRHYLCMRFARGGAEAINLPQWVTRTYMELVTKNLFSPKKPDTKPASPLRRARAASRR